MTIAVRAVEPGDVEPAIAVWRSASIARRAGRPLPPDAEARTRRSFTKPDVFAFVAEDDGRVVAVGLGMPGLADDGAGPPIAGLCDVAMVFVMPDVWGRGMGGQIVDTLLEAARDRGYERAQLWTHEDNARARRLYERRGYVTSGRRKEEEPGDPIVHYERAL